MYVQVLMVLRYFVNIQITDRQYATSKLIVDTKM
jgi:hypothetical protein